MGKNKAIAGLVLGIVGIVFSFIGTWFSVLALPISIVGLVLAITGRKSMIAENQPTGIATAALVLGIIAVVLSAIFFFTCGICVLWVANEVNDAAKDLNDLANMFG